MTKILTITIVIIIILILFHYKKYRDYTSLYQIDQQELDYVKGNELYNQLNPLVITFIEEIPLKENVIKYHLHSLLAFNKQYLTLDTKSLTNYIKHSNDVLLIRSVKLATITLINPKYNKFFKKINKIPYGTTYSLAESNFDKIKTIDVIVHDYNILYIPRHWIFKITTDDATIDMFYSHNIFSKIL